MKYSGIFRDNCQSCNFISCMKNRCFISCFLLFWWFQVYFTNSEETKSHKTSQVMKKKVQSLSCFTSHLCHSIIYTCVRQVLLTWLFFFKALLHWSSLLWHRQDTMQRRIHLFFPQIPQISGEHNLDNQFSGLQDQVPEHPSFLLGDPDA